MRNRKWKCNKNPKAGNSQKCGDHHIVNNAYVLTETHPISKITGNIQFCEAHFESKLILLHKHNSQVKRVWEII